MKLVNDVLEKLRLLENGDLNDPDFDPEEAYHWKNALRWVLEMENEE